MITNNDIEFIIDFIHYHEKEFKEFFKIHSEVSFISIESLDDSIFESDAIVLELVAAYKDEPYYIIQVNLQTVFNWVKGLS